MQASDVVITGIGMITPLGTTAESSAAAWREGKSAPRRQLPDLADTALADVVVATPEEVDVIARLGSKRMVKYMSSSAVLGCLAAREATAQAGLAERFQPERTGFFAATGLAAATVREVIPTFQASLDESGKFSCRLFGRQGLAVTNPLLSFRLLANMPASIISLQEGIKGPNYIFTPWEGHGAAALIEGWRAVASGEVDAALCGASDTAAETTCCAFLHQAGLIGEHEWPASAAAYLVFERAETAWRDARPILARIVSLALLPDDGAVGDPLAARLGRCYSAAPAVNLALTASLSSFGQSGKELHRLRGVDALRFNYVLDIGQ